MSVSRGHLATLSPRGIWSLWAHTRASCRSGMPVPGRNCPPWRATQHEWVRTPAQLCLGTQPPTRPGLTCCHPVGALAWNADQLSSGSRDRMILQRDIRTPPLQSERRLQGHRQEVCGLKWSTDHQLLASGGNDNKVWLNHPVLPQEASCLSLWVTSAG